MKTFACLFAILLFISLAHAQSCPGNLVNDPNFAGGSYYCRATADEIANDDIELCTIGYNGTDLSAILGVPDQTNLNTQLAPGGWVPTGPVDVITPNYQPTNGLWAIKLNGQFGAGGVAQNISIPLTDAACTLLLNDATNEHAPIGFSSSYQVIMQLAGSATPSYNVTRQAPPVPNPASQTTLTRENMTIVLGPAGTYTLSLISNDRNPVTFTDGLYTTQTYYGRTGAVIDSVCLTCLASPSPSVTPSVTPTSSISVSVSPSISLSSTPSISTTPSASNTPSPSPSPSPPPAPSCPAFIEDEDDDNCGIANDHEGSSQDTTTINVYFADILNMGRGY